jgi:hypothetical protein
MTRRMTKAESGAIAGLLVIGLPIYGLYKLGEAAGWGSIVAGTASMLAALLLIRAVSRNIRRRKLMEKYGDDQVVSRIMNHSYWQGQTAEQLRDSLGNPADVDESVLKTKTKEVWKYYRTGKNRFRLRVTLENSRVIGWDQKI